MESAGWRHDLVRTMRLGWVVAARDAVVRLARTHDIDGASFTVAFVWLLLYLPASLVFRPLSAAGTPATIVALLGAVCWLLYRLMDSRSRRPRPGAVPVTTAGGVFVLAVVASVVSALMRPIRPEELKSLNVGLLLVVAWAGVALLASDGIGSLARLRLVRRQLVLACAFVASVGIAQFVTGRTLTDAVTIPGLSTNTVAQVYDRGGFSRVIGTTLNPIEFGVLMAAALPLAIHHGTVSRSPAWRRWLPTVLIAASIPLSNSRSSLVALAVAMLVVLPTYSAAMRARTLVLGLFGGAAFFVLVPGLLGTLLGLFVGIQDDPSAGSRTGSYQLAAVFIARTPVFGRGFMTFLPEYRILDNQYLGLLIDTGVFGTLALLGVLVTGVVVAWRTRRSPSTEERSAAAALMAALAACTVSFAFFDALSFPTIAGFTVVCLGLVERQWRLLDPARGAPASLGSATSRTSAP